MDLLKSDLNTFTQQYLHMGIINSVQGLKIKKE